MAEDKSPPPKTAEELWELKLKRMQEKNSECGESYV
jgi:hypothetical protein